MSIQDNLRRGAEAEKRAQFVFEARKQALDTAGWNSDTETTPQEVIRKAERYEAWLLREEER